MFNGKSADEISGLYVSPFSLRTRCAEEFEVITVPNRADPIISRKGLYLPVTVQVSMDLYDYSKLDDVISWLTGSGILVDDRDEEKYRIAQVLDEIIVTPFGDDEDKMCNISVPFLCSSFLYGINSKSYTFTDNNRHYISVPGNFWTEPVITFKLKGTTATNTDVYFWITNQNPFVVRVSSEASAYEITIDCEKKNVYYYNSNGRKIDILESVRNASRFPYILNTYSGNKINNTSITCTTPNESSFTVSYYKIEYQARWR